MFASSFASWLARRNIHFAWVMAAVTFLTMLTSSAALGLPGVLLKPLSAEYGWSTEQISSALALRFLLYGLLGPFAAIFINRYGLRAVMSTALTLLAAGMLLAVEMTTFWHLVALWGIMLGVASGLTALVLGTIITNRWFETHRGLVIGTLTASIATGQLAFLPLAAWLVDNYGWRSSIFPIAGLTLIVALLAFCLVRNRPEDIGQRPYGASTKAAAAGDAGASGANPAASAAAAQPSLSLLDPLRVLFAVRGNLTFWILAGTFFICGLSTSGLIQTHFIALCGDFGLAPVPAASVLAMMGAFDFFGTIFSGWLSDRYDNRKLLFWYYGLRGLSLFWLPHSEFTFYGLTFFAAFYGLDWIATVPPTVKLATAAFGKEQAGMLFGWIFAAHQLGAATAAYGAGLTRTLLLTYTPAVYGAGAACVAAALIILAVRRTPPPSGALR